MDEQKETGGKETTTDNQSTGDKSKQNSPIELANATIQRMEEAQKKANDAIAKLEQAQANALLSGTAGGYIKTNKTETEILQEKASAVANDIVKAFH
jgi:hypothetical protein